MDTLEIFKNEFFISLQRELEAKQEYLAGVLNPNEYLICKVEIDLLQRIIDRYVHYLEEKRNAGEKTGSNK